MVQKQGTVNEEILEIYLEIWAHWSQSQGDHGLGYAKSSLLAKLKQMGGFPAYLSAKSDFIPVNYVAEELDWRIAQLRILAPSAPLEAKALCLCYLGQGSMSDRAKRLGLSYTTFKRHIDRGKYWLLGGFNSGVEKEVLLRHEPPDPGWSRQNH